MTGKSILDIMCDIVVASIIIAIMWLAVVEIGRALV